MSRRLRALTAVLAAALLAPAAASAADTPTPGALYHDGPDGRYLLGGPWQFQQGSAAPRTVTVPYAWNTGDDLKSYLGGVATYTKSFRLPSSGAGLSWVARFESVNYRAWVSLNGHRIGTHVGGFLPFEIVLPARYLHRHGANRLQVRTDSKTHALDFPYQRLSSKGDPNAGWWPYGGILREVYLRRVRSIDLENVQVLPSLHSVRGPARVAFRVLARNLSARTQRATVTARFGSRGTRLGTVTLGPGRSAQLRGSLTVSHPRLWEPGSPTLYDASVNAYAGGRRVQRYAVRTGIRQLRVSRDGEFLLNGRVLNARGMALHEDSPGKGSALDNADRNRLLDWIQQAGGTMIRAHYPLHPQMLEQADRRGMLVWSEIPFYQVKTNYLANGHVLRRADETLRDNILANGNHPSIIVWSIANELNADPGRIQAAYIRREARLARSLDPTRPVGQAFAGYPSSGCHREYAPLDVLGINLYFGWYIGRLGEIADRTLLSNYLDWAHRCYRDKAIFATEYGAEANRDGPADEKGTYAFQANWVRDTIATFDTKPWLAGALYWTIQEFRIRPHWDGSNPWPTSPLHQKGLIRFDGTKKPAYDVVAQMYKAHPQLLPPR
jgi:beta-glucuronidase